MGCDQDQKIVYFVESIGDNKIRLWKLGSLEHKIIPSKETIEKFRKILEDWDRTKILDIVWDAAIDVQIIDKVYTF